MFFWILYFLFFINEVKEDIENISALHRRSINASKVDGKRSLLKFLLVNILYPNSFTLEPDLSFS